MGGPHRVGEPVVRSLYAALAALALLGLSSLAIVWRGEAMKAEQPVIEIDTIDDPGEDSGQPVPDIEPDAGPVGAVDVDETTQRLVSPEIVAPSRLVEPEVVAPPQLSYGDLKRAPPRDALSELSLALPPPPETAFKEGGTVLFNTVATAAGVLAAKNATVQVDGIEIVPAEATCDADGRSWPCGMRARAAFRAMLRGRAVTCDVATDADPANAVAPCRVGKQDVGTWLVTNGWARALADGPYADAGKAAREQRKGIFGAPPVTDAPPLPSAAAPALPEPLAVEPEPTPPDVPQAPLQ